MRRYSWLTTAVAAALALAGAALPRAQQSPPDLILSNGRIVTVDDRFTVAEAVAIRGNRVAAVGSSEAIARLAGAGTRTIDLQGRTVIPGLIDNHMHLLRAAGTWQLELRWEGVYSRREAIDLLRARARAVGPGHWVFNIGGWATAQFADDARPFTREELDRIAPDNPVALQESYYQVFLNSRGLEAFGIREGEPDPEDFVAGSIQRDPAGRPTGVIRGDIAATRPVAARLPKVDPAQLEASAAAMVADMNRAGLTSFGVAGCTDEVLEIVQRWKAEGRLNVRIYCIGGASAGSPAQVERSLPQIAQMKLFQGDEHIDHVVFGESVYTPLHDRMFAFTSDPPPDQLAEWRRMAMAIAEAGLPLHVHANLTPTIDAFLDQIEAVNAVYPVRNLRWALAHVNQITAPQLARMRALGMYAAVHPWGVINGGIMHEGFGDAAFDLAPLRTIQDSGIVWGFGSDGSAANQYLPFTTLHFAVTGTLASGRPVIRQTIDREEALIAHTSKNAFLVFQENNLGSIQPGKLADLVVLDRDYLTVPADEIKDITPVMTMVDGRIVYEAAAAPAQTAAAGAVALTGARLIDGTGGAPIEQATLVVRAGRVEAVGAAAAVAVPADAVRINLAGKTIVPGFVNAHAHADPDDGDNRPVREQLIDQLRLYADYGVTTAVVLGSSEAGLQDLIRLRDEQDGTVLDRARVYVAPPSVRQAGSADEVRTIIDRGAGQRVDLIKIHVTGGAGDMTPAVYGALIDRAHARGLRVAAHLYYAKDAWGLLGAGADIFAHSVRDEQVDEAMIAELRRRGVGYIPTLTRELSVFVYETTPAFFSDPFFLRHADRAAMARLGDPARQERTRNSPQAQTIKEALAQAGRNLKLLSDAGVAIAMGTDSGAGEGRWQGFFEHVELELMVQAGLTPMQALVAATGGAARVMRLDAELGTLQAGKQADLIVLNANPLADIRNTRQIDSVWIAGRQLPPRD